MGQSRGIDDDQIRRRQTPSIPIHESIVPRNDQKQRGGKLSIHFCADPGTIETVFRQLFLSISSVFTEQSQKCVKNETLAMIEQGDLL